MKKIILFILITFLVSGCSTKSIKQPDVNITKKILVVVAPRDFDDSEYAGIKNIIETNGYQIVNASIQKTDATGIDQLKVKIDISAGEAKPADYDALIFIGGKGMAQITDDEIMKTLADLFDQAGKVVAAISVAPEILAKAEILKGKNATSVADAKTILVESGAIFKDDPVVVDNNIVTANGLEAVKQFGEKIIEVLKTRLPI